MFIVCGGGLLTLTQAFAQPCRIVGTLQTMKETPEASGIAVSKRNPGIVWSHNDSGEPILFALDANGNVKGQIRVTGAPVVDWEDIAVAPCPKGSCLYIADIGDNRGLRRQITVYRVPEPGLGEDTTEQVEGLHATYPDGPQDAEGMFVTPDAEVFLITKTKPAVYRFPKPARAGSTVVLERVSTPPDLTGSKKDGRVTGAAASPDGKWVALRTHRSVLFYRKAELLSGAAATSRFDLTALHERQGEGIAWGADGAIFVTGEGGAKTLPGNLGRMTCIPDGTR